MEFTRMEKRMYELEIEITRLAKILDIICEDHSIMHTMAVHEMRKGAKEPEDGPAIKYELSEFAKANYGRGYTD
jgi:hypothetical protein